MTLDPERRRQALTRVTRLVFPQHTNPIGTLYGGMALQWMDEVAFFAATRYARRQVVTVSMDRVDFKVPIPEGAILELLADVVEIGTSSLSVKVQMLIEDAMANTRQLAIEGMLVMVAVDSDMRPVAVDR
ncbi:MAG: acyl-CoA thioesterase [Wenzhouxiangella sp.]|jgi:acyl-CoA hydrolase|nr:acyl-CoA thioesterase [Wenzhouxiangella sp.]